MKLVLLTTARCNASCGHCSTSCGPEKTESLSQNKIFGLMDEAAELAEGKPLKFLLTGGEPFMDFELLLSIVAYGARLGAIVTCVTNGYWATSPEKARSMLSAVQDAGLRALAVSTSRFHQQFVKLKRVERVLGAARDLGLTCCLKYVRLPSDAQDEETIKAWAMAAGADEVEDFSLLPYLRDGESLPDSAYIRSPGLPEGRCPAPLLTVREDGEAYFCCTPGADRPLLFLGNTHELRLREVHDRFYLGGMQQILRQHGPIFFARAAEAQSQGYRLRESYTNVCELCTHIVNDPDLAAVATETAQAFEVQQLRGILEALAPPEKPLTTLSGEAHLNAGV